VPCDRQLLEIFLTKNGRVRREEMKQLRHDGADAAEMTGAGSATESLGKRCLLHEGGAILRIHFVRQRPKEKIHSFRPADFVISFLGPWITRKIRAGLELKRINEDAHRHFAIRAGVVPREPDERDMAGMQSAHGWDQNAPPAWRRRLSAQLGDGGKDLHR